MTGRRLERRHVGYPEGLTLADAIRHWPKSTIALMNISFDILSCSPSLCCLFTAFLICSSANGQREDVNYDEAKAPKYLLPDPLRFENGERVADKKAWVERRRPEILRAFENNVYGRAAARSAKVTFELSSIEAGALAGKAIRKQVSVLFAGRSDGPKMQMLMYLPTAVPKPVPMFLGLNFPGNHTVDLDPGIQLGDVWVRDGASKKTVKKHAEEKSRGASASQWQVDKILTRGYGLATIYYGDIEPDFDGGIQHGVRPLFYKPGQTVPAPDEWGSIGAWAWALSRAMDYLDSDKDVDAKRVILMGHSRLGKTALWAGAQDTRFAMVISNDSGEGGAALSRRKFGETVKHLNTSFPHWFSANYKKFNDREDEMPVDQHMLLALIAPRPLYVASAEEDRWADPRGEFLSAVGAGPVYRLLGKQGLETDQMPEIHKPIMNTVGYHIRAGKHDVTAYDWDRYLDFADKHLRR